MEYEKILAMIPEFERTFAQHGVLLRHGRLGRIHKAVLTGGSRNRNSGTRAASRLLDDIVPDGGGPTLVVSFLTRDVIDVIRELALSGRGVPYVLESPFAPLLRAGVPDNALKVVSSSEFSGVIETPASERPIGFIFPEFESTFPGSAVEIDLLGHGYLASVASYVIARKSQARTAFLHAPSRRFLASTKVHWHESVEDDEMDFRNFYRSMALSLESWVERIPESILSLPVMLSRYRENREARDRVDRALLDALTFELTQKGSVAESEAREIVDSIRTAAESLEEEYQEMYCVAT